VDCREKLKNKKIKKGEGPHRKETKEEKPAKKPLETEKR